MKKIVTKQSKSMVQKITVMGVFLLIQLGISPTSFAKEKHVEQIISQVKQTKKEIESTSNDSKEMIFLAFWDFDGTILKGDCTEGLKKDDKWVYHGLTEQCIHAGLSSIYRGEDGFQKFWKDYQYLEHNVGRWFAYPFAPQILRGSKASDVSELARTEFNKVYKNYYFQSSATIFHDLEADGVKNYIISASADIFVDAAASTLKLPTERFHGIEMKIEDGRMTEKLIYPVTWSDGKVEKIKQIVAGIQVKNPKKQIIILAAFGNSYNTDGPFLKYVAQQKFTKGKPLSVMINGGDAPAGYKHLFFEVNQDEVVQKEP